MQDTILVVDDESSVRQTVREWLTQAQLDCDILTALRALRPRNSRAQTGLFLKYAPELGISEMPDPYYRDADAFEQVLDMATAASRGLLLALQERA